MEQAQVAIHGTLTKVNVGLPCNRGLVNERLECLRL